MFKECKVGCLVRATIHWNAASVGLCKVHMITPKVATFFCIQSGMTHALYFAREYAKQEITV